MAGLFALALGYVLSQFYRTFLAVLTPALKTDIGATNADLSIASGAWFATFALMQFVVGVSLDRCGPKRTASVLLAVGGGGGALLFAFATAPWMVILAMALVGVGCAPVLMASVFIFARNYTPARLAILTSWMVAFGSAGNVVGASPLANAAEAFGWREVMVVLGVVTLVVAAAIRVLVRDPARVDDAGSAASGFSGYLELLRLRDLWPLIPIVGLSYAPSAGIRGLWAGPYLWDVYGADTIVIGNVTLFMALAMVAGSILYGPLDTLLRTRKWVVVGGSSLCLAAVISLAAAPAPGIVAATVHFVLIGVFGASYGLLLAHGGTFLPPRLIGRGMTLLNFFSVGGVALAQFATGAVYSASVVPGEPAAAYGALFAFYALLLGGAILVYLFSRDARPGAEVPSRISAGAR